MQNLKKLLIFSLGLFLLVFSPRVFAASLNLSPQTGSFRVGDNIAVRLRVSSQNVSVNAISASLNFSNDTLILNSISKSGSIITLWPVEPSFSNQSSQASLEGVVLSGFSGSGGTVVTLNFRAVKEGQAFVRFISSSVLANDGQGTNVLDGSSGSNFSILASEPRATTTTTKTESPKTEIKIGSQNLIKIEELRSLNNEQGRASFLIIPTRSVRDKTYSIQIDGQEIFSYIDQGYGIYQTDILPEGKHTIRVSAYDQKGSLMEGVTEFDITLKGLISQSLIDTNLGKNFNRDTGSFIKHMFGIILILVAILVFGFLRIRRAKKLLGKKIQEARRTVNKAFNILEDDEDEENKLIRKLKNKKVLSENDEANLDQFSKDLSDAEKVISDAINEIKENE